MNKNIEEQILQAEAKALATSGPYGINVVPVSVVEIVDGIIYLYNFFMHKTAENIKADPEVALSCWKGLSGIQVKATAEYITEGDLFLQAIEKMKVRFPERTLRGIIALKTTSAFDISADSARAGVEIEI